MAQIVPPTRVLLIAFGLLSCFTAAMPAAAQGIWSVKAPMPVPREDVGAVALDDKIYVLAGTAHEDAQITRSEVYDPATDRWSTRAPMPRGTHHLAVALTNTNRSLHDVYDPATDSWTSAAPMPTPRSSVGIT